MNPISSRENPKIPNFRSKKLITSSHPSQENTDNIEHTLADFEEIQQALFRSEQDSTRFDSFPYLNGERRNHGENERRTTGSRPDRTAEDETTRDRFTA
ncbi:uncharacterized protein G2W53_027632 [Senna tora]|uniref:Uncharacterized protein n=1 Tax=Senna tora TaxID=362788 RepID=A0A834TH79_9FABA|nr:uncharacterized protein G2W53_027632 [Senna tora]